MSIFLLLAVVVCGVVVGLLPLLFSNHPSGLLEIKELAGRKPVPAAILMGVGLLAAICWVGSNATGVEHPAAGVGFLGLLWLLSLLVGCVIRVSITFLRRSQS